MAFIDIHTEYSCSTVQYAVECTQYSSHYHSCKKSSHAQRQDLLHQGRVYMVLVFIHGIAKVVESDHSGNNNNDGNQDFQNTREEQSFLRLLQVFCSKCPLYNGLVHAPEIELIDYQSREQHSKWHNRIFGANHREFLRRMLIDLG